ncbi:hypothetical protein QRB41_26515, partial [Mycobacterium avium subsp. hominissuis]|uniref:hypothetical protein n=1 Tax=Mycobacterium avium TaxID=1764 RepID=UPI0026652729
MLIINAIHATNQSWAQPNKQHGDNKNVDTQHNSQPNKERRRRSTEFAGRSPALQPGEAGG